MQTFTKDQINHAVARLTWSLAGDMGLHDVRHRWWGRRVALYSPSLIEDATGMVIGVVKGEESAPFLLVALDGEYLCFEQVPLDSVTELPGGAG